MQLMRKIIAATIIALALALASVPAKSYAAHPLVAAGAAIAIGAYVAYLAIGVKVILDHVE